MAFKENKLQVVLLYFFWALAGSLIGYLAGAYLGDIAVARRFPHGEHMGDGLEAFLITSSFITSIAPVGFVGGLWAASVIQRRKRNSPILQ